MIRVVPLAGLLSATLLSATLVSGCALPGNARLTSRCEADQAIGYVGQRFTPPMGKVIQKKTRSKAARVIAPDTMVTQDFRVDRVNVAIDDRNIVTRVYCG